jgi:hypothetical protein
VWKTSQRFYDVLVIITLVPCALMASALSFFSLRVVSVPFPQQEGIE